MYKTKNLMKYNHILILTIISLMKPLIAFCGNNTDNQETLLNDMLTYIDNQPEEANRDLLAFFEGLPPHPNNLNIPGLQATDTINQGPRFGWESLAVFIGASVLGYILIRHGADIYRGAKDFMLDLVQHTSDLTGAVTREAVRQAAIRAIQNPNNHERIEQFITGQ
jgi:hypothetical protein